LSASFPAEPVMATAPAMVASVPAVLRTLMVLLSCQ
jgi:hypothetical protein